MNTCFPKPITGVERKVRENFLPSILLNDNWGENCILDNPVILEPAVLSVAKALATC